MLTVTGQATQCVFDTQGTSMTGSSFTESMTKSLLECQSACSADSICLAVTHKSGNNNCRLHDSTETTSIGCADCTYYLKLCAYTTSMTTLLCHFFSEVILVLFVHNSRIACLLFYVDILFSTPYTCRDKLKKFKRKHIVTLQNCFNFVQFFLHM